MTTDITPKDSIVRVLLDTKPLPRRDVDESALPHEITVADLRAEAYREKADPLFFKWQRDEGTKEEWLAAIETIKKDYPYTEAEGGKLNG
jgi:hypothetical protein